MSAEFSQDHLTSLPNLIGMIEDLSKLPTGRGALIVFDLVSFGRTNREYGHATGDGIIQTLADALRAASEPRGDRCRVYRVGGDEFLVSYANADAGDVEEFVGECAVRFEEALAAEALPKVRFRHAAAMYPEEATTLASLLVRLHLNLFQLTGRSRRTKNPPPWVEGLLAQLIRRFDETIGELREAQQLALTDAISGLPNHRAAQATLERLIAQQARDGQPFSMLFVDGDNLKAYNERFDYDKGNQMIRHLARVVADGLRRGDYVFRWLSGDEFLVMLPGTDRRVAKQVAERLRNAVSEGFSGWPVPVTVSVGIVVCPADGTNPEQLITRAAAANAQAKAAGKNRVM